MLLIESIWTFLAAVSGLIHLTVVHRCAGNISAGKSTLCRALADTLGYTLYLEPTVENPFLAKYYKYGGCVCFIRFAVLFAHCCLHAVCHSLIACWHREPKKYALPMQCWLLKQRFVTYVAAVRSILSGSLSAPGVILDRSVRMLLALPFIYTAY
jgi:deoxyadenosine/deoxycytidine kinase